MLEKISAIDKIEVLEGGQIQVRRADRVMDDGIEIAKTYHRHVLAPGDNLNNQDARVVAIAQTVWTPEVIAAYQASLSEE